MKHKKRNFLLCLLICFISFSTSLVTLAATHYILLGKGYYKSSVSINSAGVSSEYTSYWNSAVDAWNNSDAGVSISSSNYSSNTIVTKSLSNQTYYGEYSWSSLQVIISTGRVKQFDITINTYTCTKDYMVSAMVHELGHAFNLDDNPCNTSGYYNSSIMNYGRDRNVLKSPTSWDIEGVEESY